jgi:hypothetical protein
MKNISIIALCSLLITGCAAPYSWFASSNEPEEFQIESIEVDDSSFVLDDSFDEDEDEKAPEADITWLD